MWKKIPYSLRSLLSSNVKETVRFIAIHGGKGQGLELKLLIILQKFLDPGNVMMATDGTLRQFKDTIDAIFIGEFGITIPVSLVIIEKEIIDIQDPVGL